jgi:antitoxin VapB
MPAIKMPEKKSRSENATAKLFMHGRSQAVRLPKEFRLTGKEVRVRKVGSAVLLEPIARTREEIEAVWAEIDALRHGGELFSESDVAEQASEPDPRRFFNE